MKARVYKKFITSRIKDSDRRNREIVLNSLLAGTFILLSIFLLLLIVSAFFGPFPAARVAATCAVLLFIGFLFRLSRTGSYRLAAALLVTLYLLLAIAVVAHWGLFAANGVLLFSLVVVLSGILLGAIYSLYAVLVVMSALALVQAAHAHGLLTPDLRWITQPTAGVDVISYTALFSVIALVSWLFNHQMERSLKRAERAERALSRQKELLEVKVEERTRQLKAAQLEEMQQLYRFAELGQLSTAMLHDLANHLTTLTLDIEGLEERTNSRLVKRAKRSIRYIDDMVHEVRDQLHGANQKRRFSAAGEIDEVIKILTEKARRSHVVLGWESPPDKFVAIQGESVRFRQLIANLISNGIDAYPQTTHLDPDRRVAVNLTVDSAKRLKVTVSDWGRGIDAENRAKIFDPFYSTKTKGMGIGLFIARQIVEEHFGGTISVDGREHHTVFTVTLKRAS